MLELFKALGVEDPKIKVNFGDVVEAENFKTTLPEGLYATKITAATVGITDKKKPIWNIEYTIESGQHQGEVVKDTVYLIGEDEAKTKKLMNKIQRMFSRILGAKIEGETDILSIDFRLFIGQRAVIELEQKPSVKDGKTNYFSNIKFAGFYNIADYSGDMDTKLKHCQGYLDKLAGKVEATAPAATTPAATTGGYKF